MKIRIAKRLLPEPEQGFTILETCIALVVMMVVGLGAAGAFVFAIRYNSAAADRATSMSIAQTTIEKFRALPFTDAALNTGTTTSTVTIQDPNNNTPGRSYTVTTTVAIVTGKTTIKSITVSVVPIAPIIPIDSATYASGYEYYGSVKLYTERCSPLVGANLH